MVCRSDVALVLRDVFLTISLNPGQEDEKNLEDETEKQLENSPGQSYAPINILSSYGINNHTGKFYQRKISAIMMLESII